MWGEEGIAKWEIDLWCETITKKCHPFCNEAPHHRV